MAVLAGAIQSGAWAQTFPSKPIKLVVATPAGGPLDALARIIGEAASRNLGQPIIIENKVGGTGAVAMIYLLQQPADGYTIHLTANAALFTQYIQTGKIRGLATTSSKRLSYLPDVPTLAEAGFPNLQLEEGVFYGLVGPAGMPQAVIDRLYQALTTAMADPETNKKLASMGFDVSPREGAAFRRDLLQELAGNEKNLKTLTIRME